MVAAALAQFVCFVVGQGRVAGVALVNCVCAGNDLHAQCWVLFERRGGQRL